MRPNSQLGDLSNESAKLPNETPKLPNPQPLKPDSDEKNESEKSDPKSDHDSMSSGNRITPLVILFAMPLFLFTCF